MVYILKKVIKICKVKDMTGMTFGRLKVIERADNDKNGNAFWKCKCECGAIVIVNGNSMRRGHTKSCGCLHKDKLIEINTKHGKCNERIYSIWAAMISRCTNEKNAYYINYGGKGIKVCDEWKDSSKFIEWAYNNGYSDELTIDRIDNKKGYCKENCRWVTRAEQNRNTTRNKYVNYKGEKICLAEAGRILGKNRSESSKLNKTGMLQKMLDEYKEE